MDQICKEVLAIDEAEQLQNDSAASEVDQPSYKFLQEFILRQLTFKYTCPLTVLYGASKAGKSFE